MTRKALSAAKKQDIYVDAIIDTLKKVEVRFACRDEAASITAALVKLKANRKDKTALTEAVAYCSDRWVLGPTH
jgi:hypothetical protein